MKRKAHITYCQTCRQPIIAGLDRDVAATLARCEIGRILPDHEPAAIATGRATYNLDNEQKLWHRHPFQTATGHTPHGEPILAAHQCGQPLPAVWLQPPHPPTSSNVTKPSEDDPCRF